MNTVSVQSGGAELQTGFGLPPIRRRAGGTAATGPRIAARTLRGKLPALCRPAGLFQHGQVDHLSRDWSAQTRKIGAWLQSLGLAKGDRVAVMMPNILQNPDRHLWHPARRSDGRERQSALYAARAGASAARFRRQGDLRARKFRPYRGAGARTTPMSAMSSSARSATCWAPRGTSSISSCARSRSSCRPGRSRGHQDFQAGAGRRRAAAAETGRALGASDIAFLQYTGGTTGIAKGAMLTHANLLANKQQLCSGWTPPIINKQRPEVLTFVCALPLYHIFALTVNSLMGMSLGAHNVLIANPRDIPAFVKELRQASLRYLPGPQHAVQRADEQSGFRQARPLALVLHAWRRHGGAAAGCRTLAEDDRRLDHRGLRPFRNLAGCQRQPLRHAEFTGTIGLPLPSTDIDIRDDDGNSLPLGEVGEICIRGPQVMAGYWQQPDETAKVMTADGFFRSGDMGFMDDARLYQDRRPQEGHDPRLRLQRLSQRDRGSGGDASGHPRRRRDRRCRTSIPARPSSSSSSGRIRP